MFDWVKIRNFVHKRTLFCSAAVMEEGGIRMFPIGSLRVGRDGSATYFELFARPVAEGTPITFMAVDVGLWFWLTSLLKHKDGIGGSDFSSKRAVGRPSGLDRGPSERWSSIGPNRSRSGK